MAQSLLNLSKSFIATLLFVSFAMTALAQTKPVRQSRLDIGKKPQAVVLKKSVIKYPLKTSFKLGEIRYKQPDVVNQYFKNLLLTPTANSKNITLTKNSENLSQESFKNELIDKNEKLFSNEKIIVSAAYPNPANESTNIDFYFANGTTEAKVLIFSVFATQIAEYQLDKSDKKISIPTERLASGVYYYQLIVDGKMVNSKKLLIRH